MSRRRESLGRLLAPSALLLLTCSCATRLAIVTLEDAEDRERNQHRITLEGERIPVKELTEIPQPPTIRYRVRAAGSGDSDPASVASVPGEPTSVGFTLTFLAENDAARAWVLSRDQFRLSEVRVSEPGASLELERLSDATASSGEILLFLPPGETGLVHVPFAVEFAEGLPTANALSTIYTLQVRERDGGLMLQRNLEVGSWHPPMQALRAAVLATLVFLIWGALG